MERLYCGVDFHKRTSTFYVVNGEGKPVETGTLESSQLVAYLANKKHFLVGIEASGGTNDMVAKIKALGLDVKIVNPNKFRAIGLGGKKTDARDAQMLAEALRLNFIPEVHHKSLYARQLKSLIVGREMLVRSRVNMMNHVRGTLREYGISMTQGKEAFLEGVDSAIGQVECVFIREHLTDLSGRIKALCEREKAIEVQLEELSKADERIMKLRTIPGIGLMTSVTFVAVMDDCGRFKSAKHFASYIGLVPSEHSSGDKRRMGSVTRSGSEILRRYLIHGARSVLMYSLRSNSVKSDRMKSWAVSLKDRVGMNKATVALAHRLSRIGYAVLRDGKTYTSNPKKEDPVAPNRAGS